MVSEPVRIAMWSGPRTVSTALLRAWENRPDTVVADEPLYAFYLDRTGLEHPGREQVIASQPTSWATVIRELTTGSLPAGRTVFYAKHMTHHLLPEVDREALAPLRTRSSSGIPGSCWPPTRGCAPHPPWMISASGSRPRSSTCLAARSSTPVTC